MPRLRLVRRADGSDAVDPVVDALARAATGDEAAFGEFYDHVASAVYGTVLKVLRNPAMAEEVTQEVFLELWRTAPRYDAGRGSPRTWATTVAHRRAVDRVRSEQAARNREEVDAHHVDRPADQVVDEVVLGFERDEVAAAMARLTPVQRDAIALAYYEGRTYREVAELLGVPEGTIKTRIRDGIGRLREMMGAPS